MKTRLQKAPAALKSQCKERVVGLWLVLQVMCEREGKVNLPTN